MVTANNQWEERCKAIGEENDMKAAVISRPDFIAVVNCKFCGCSPELYMGVREAKEYFYYFCHKGLCHGLSSEHHESEEVARGAWNRLNGSTAVQLAHIDATIEHNLGAIASAVSNVGDTLHETLTKIARGIFGASDYGPYVGAGDASIVGQLSEGRLSLASELTNIHSMLERIRDNMPSPYASDSRLEADSLVGLDSQSLRALDAITNELSKIATQLMSK